MFDLKFSKQVKKFIEKQDKKTKKRFKDIFQKLAENPHREDIDIKKMTNSKFFRLRISKYRFLYFIEEDKLLIVVEEGDSRGDVYKKRS